MGLRPGERRTRSANGITLARPHFPTAASPKQADSAQARRERAQDGNANRERFETAAGEMQNSECGGYARFRRHRAAEDRERDPDEIRNRGLNTEETRILTVGNTVPWDNSIEKVQENSGTLIYANRHKSVDRQFRRLSEISVDQCSFFLLAVSQCPL
jgi:hypothetical protein